MDGDEAKTLLDELAGRPSETAWRWIQDALVEVPPDQQDEVADHAERALAAWPDVLREGKRWHKGSPVLRSPLFRIVRALTNAGHLHPTPSMAPAGPPSRLRVLRLADVGAQALDVLEPWEGMRRIEVLHLDRWKQYEPGLAGRLLATLDASVVRELGFVKQDAAMDEVVRALRDREWPALRSLAIGPLRDEHVGPLLAATSLGNVESLRLDLRGLGPEAALELVRGLGRSGVRELVFVSPIDPPLASAAASRFGALDVLRAPFLPGALAAFASAAETCALRSLILEYGSKSDAAECGTLAACAGALRSLSITNGANIDDAAVAALAPLSGLEALSLAYCTFGDEGLVALANASRATLRALEVRVAPELGDRGVSALASAACCAQLERLVLRETGAGDRAAEAIAKSLRRLHELDLSHGAAGLQGLTALLESELAGTIEDLRFDTPLSRNKRIGDRGAERIAACERLTGLRRLSLAAQDIHYDVLLEHFGSATHLHGLEELDVTDNPEFFDGGETMEALRALGFSKLREVRAGTEV